MIFKNIFKKLLKETFLLFSGEIYEHTVGQNETKRKGIGNMIKKNLNSSLITHHCDLPQIFISDVTIIVFVQSCQHTCRKMPMYEDGK